MMTNTVKEIGRMSAADRRILDATIVNRVSRDPDNEQPLTRLLWAVHCDLVDVEAHEQEVLTDLDF